MHTAIPPEQTPRRFRLRDADPTLRLLLTAFVIVLSLGYAVGLLFVEHTTSVSPQGVIEEFNGSSDGGTTVDMKFEMSPRAMLTLIHNHVLSLSIVFLGLGGIFYFSSLVSEALKRFLLIEPFVAIITTFGGIALVRYLAPGFSWLVLVSGASLLLSYSVMVVLILAELWARRPG